MKQNDFSNPCSNRPAKRLARAILALGIGAAPLLATAPASAEPAACLSSNPADWPASSKPYFMIIVDTSGSMFSTVTSTNSCGYPVNDRISHARCAVKNTVEAFSEVNFGLATYTWKETCTQNPAVACNDTGFGYSNCTAQYAPNDNNACGPTMTEPTLGTTIHRGGFVVVPMLQDAYWNPPPPPASNVPSIVQYVDNTCGSANPEIGADSNTPLGGALFNMWQYFGGTYTDPFTSTALSSPIGTAAQGERPCRSINVILITDGDETCDTGGVTGYPNGSSEAHACYEANRLYQTGVTVGGQTFHIKTYVIGFVGANTTALNHIASYGGTTKAFSTANEADLSAALATIVSSAIKPETCDNTDNNCNGCTDEGFKHYCDQGQTCCAWTTDAQRTTCLTGYQATITTANPQGDLTKLPCTTQAQQSDPAHWLCYDPKETCDGTDNNCNGTVDENQLKCGNPAHCPMAETCNAQDDNCDGIVDNASGSNIPYSLAGCTKCVPSPEICDGCDNDCDGVADNGVADIPCGLPPSSTTPAYCAGTQTCKASANVGVGKCEAGGPGNFWNTCSASGPFPPETCNGLDDDCNGKVDDGIAPTPCKAPGDPGTWVYGGNSQCKMGTQACGGSCVGAVGPSAEVCDGIDNDCDGVIDDGTLPGVGNPCGSAVPPCSKGLTACVGGVLVCQGGTQPQPEVCNGIDDNCNGVIDDSLTDTPPNPGCWNDPGNQCSYGSTQWSPPPGATCTDLGSLTAPCAAGHLACVQGAWKCLGGVLPTTEQCNGVDDNCNGQVDESNTPPLGSVCGSNVGECKQGVLVCNAGVVGCQGAVGPTPEVCDGKDNDCDGVIDNGIVLNAPCDPPYDTTQYPGPRQFTGECHQGTTACDGNGNVICVGGKGPSPEVCDGKDNDCDGKIDESGAAPDGIDGTANPADSTQIIGDKCGSNVGACVQGQYECVNGQFACIGAKGPSPEVCDCIDNDCNGLVDEDPGSADAGGDAGAATPICGAGSSKVCVSHNGSCECAAPCKPNETNPSGCPTGNFTCVDATESGGGSSGKYCWSDACGNCDQQTVKVVKDGGASTIECAPSNADAGATTPECVCKGQSCHKPCYGVTCTAPLLCTDFGPKKGTCVADNCFNIPCPTGQDCNLGSCVTDPCSGKTCPAGQYCKPSADFTTGDCVKSCAGVTCPSGQICHEGSCVDTGCPNGCPAGTACSGAEAGAQCVNKCATDGGEACPNGGWCDPATGQCGNDPCEGIVCPQGQSCQNGDCFAGQAGAGGAGGGAGAGGASGGGGAGGAGAAAGAGGGSGGTAGSAGTPTSEQQHGLFGLATGGGGCSCETGPHGGRSGGEMLLLLGLGLALPAARRSRKRRDATSPAAGRDGGVR